MRAAIVLAAGRSRRFGAPNKLLTPFRGRPLLHHAIDAACKSPVGRVLVIVGKDSRVAACARAFRGGRIEIVGPVRDGGRRASLAAGLQALRRRESAAFVFLGDMPFLDPTLARRLARRDDRRASAIRPVWCGRPGHPVLLVKTAEARARLARRESPFDADALVELSGAWYCVADIDRPGQFRGRRVDR